MKGEKMPGDRQKQLRALHEILIERRNQLEKTLGRKEAEINTLNVGVIGTHEAENASDITIQNTLEALGQCISDQLAAVYQALSRYETGQYGVCECCEREILIERLQAIPEATMCVNCQSAHRRRRQGRR